MNMKSTVQNACRGLIQSSVGMEWIMSRGLFDGFCALGDGILCESCLLHLQSSTVNFVDAGEGAAVIVKVGSNKVIREKFCP